MTKAQLLIATKTKSDIKMENLKLKHWLAVVYAAEKVPY